MILAQPHKDDFSQARKTPGCQIHLGDRPIQVSVVNMFRKSIGSVRNFFFGHL